MSGEPVEIAAADGSILRGLRWGGAPPAVLLIHAPGEERDIDDWRPLLPYLLGVEAAIVAFDLRGHGASDGAWDPEVAVEDLVAAVVWCRERVGETIVCGAGASATASLRAAERGRMAGIVLLSPAETETLDLRGAGVPKLIVCGAMVAEARATATRVRTRSIGPAVSVSLPTAAQGTDLLTSDVAIHVREHLLGFWRERAAERASGCASAVEREVPNHPWAALGAERKGDWA